MVYVLMEVRQETDYVLHHAQKILALFAAMRDFARELRAGGHRVRYVALDDPSNRQSIPGNLAALAAHYAAQRIEWQQPDEWRLDAQLQAWGADLPLDWRLLASGYLAGYLQQLGALAPGHEQAELQQRGRITQRARADGGSTLFSQRIRQGVPGIDQGETDE